jgi:DNA (cytosine-5)-methyltransferase 1
VGEIKEQLTYVSLFSSAGVGCYGFKLEGFECVATNELIDRRLSIQKANRKCKYESGYVQGDISTPEVKEALFAEIQLWRRKENLREVDVVIATPPCQGMSVANHKKTSNEIVRNSLIVESISLVSEIEPRVFVFENVPRFMATICTDTDGVERPIGEAIDRNLAAKYSIYSRVVNFKEFGASSSRSRALVIGVRNDLADHVSPIDIFPARRGEVSLRDAISNFKPLTTMGEIDSTDIYHSFRPYPAHMEKWISNLEQGQSAFENTQPDQIPHQIIDGKIVINQQKNGDKYRRQLWDKVGPCVHTRNDQLASQNTVHPRDNRVFSIRELMAMMTVPESFRWVDASTDELNNYSEELKREFLKRNEMNIRQSLGEAVPTEIFRVIAQNYKSNIAAMQLSDSQIRALIEEMGLSDVATFKDFLKKNSMNLAYSTLSRFVELANSKRQEQEAYFTNKRLVTEIVKRLPTFNSDEISILEPSVGAGNFLPLLLKHLDNKRRIKLTVNDIDANALELLKSLIGHLRLSQSVSIRYTNHDYLLQPSNEQFDLVIGNPPFSKSAQPDLLRKYRFESVHKNALNTAVFFLEKAVNTSGYVAMVMPKFLLNTPEFGSTRSLLESKRIDYILDFGERGFGGVLVETVALLIDTSAKPSKTTVVSSTENIVRTTKQSYITDARFPYWIIYRDESFDQTCEKLKFDVFQVFRDRQITTKLLKSGGDIRVVKSRNLSEDGKSILDIDGYDSYIDLEIAKRLAVYRYLDASDVYLTPNMTYKPRLVPKPAGTLVNGSAAILTLKPGEAPLTERQIRFFSSPEYRSFYKIARNFQTRSLNVDANSVFFFAKLLTKRS